MGGRHFANLEVALRPDRLYPVRTYAGYGFYAGLAAGNCQLLAAADGNSLIVVLFDAAGDLLAVDRVELAEEEVVERVLALRYEWEAVLVRVKRFRVPLGAGQHRKPLPATLVGEEGFAIEPIPPDWRHDLEHPEGLAGEWEDFAEMVRGWLERGNFVLYWGNAYDVDGSGRVVGS